MYMKVYLYLWVITVSWITSCTIVRDLDREIINGSWPKFSPSLHQVTNFYDHILPSLGKNPQYLPCPDGCLCIVQDADHHSVCTGPQHSTVPQGLNVSTTIFRLSLINIAKLQPASFVHLPNLRVLILQDFELVEHLGPRTFEGLEALEVLVIYCCWSIKSIDAHAFLGLCHLKHLYLVDSWLCDVQDQVFVALSSLEYLTLSNNNITSLPEEYHIGFNLLKYLDISDNYITVLPVRVFGLLSQLEILDLHNNTISALPETVFFGLPNLQHLNLSDNNIAVLPEQAFAFLSQLEILDLYKNKISGLPETVFSGLPNLQYLNLSHNYIAVLPERVFAFLSQLKILDVHKNKILALPKKVFFGLPNLQYLSLSNNYIAYLPENIFVVQNRLRYLDLSRNNIDSLSDHIFSSLISLSILQLSHNTLQTLSSNAFTSMKQLRYLNVSYNKLNYCKKSCKNSMFDLDLPMLKTFIISYNHIMYQNRNLFNANLNEVLEELYMDGIRIHISRNISVMDKLIPNYGVLKALKNLKVLSLKRCRISTFLETVDIFQNLEKLEVLDLSRVRLLKRLLRQNSTALISATMFENSTQIRQLKLNKLDISSIADGVLNQLVHLKSLQLSGNKIESVNFTFLPSKLWTQLDEIDLSYNPFLCDCQIMWFHHWLSATNLSVLQINDPFAYKCAYPHNKRGEHILSITGMNNCYAAAPDTLRLSVWLSLFIFFLVSLFSSILHKFRWHVLYWQLQIQSQIRQHNEMIEQREFAYDAFVMYSSEDHDWVEQHLRPQLEEKPAENLRLCLHERDWKLGAEILENIVESIESSRKWLFLVSNEFVKSNWCNYEMTLVQSRAIREDTTNAILVLLEEIAPIYITPRLRLQMQSQTYIEWTEDEVGQRLFWTRLRQALKKPQQSLAHELPQRSDVIELE